MNQPACDAMCVVPSLWIHIAHVDKQLFCFFPLFLFEIIIPLSVALTEAGLVGTVPAVSFGLWMQVTWEFTPFVWMRVTWEFTPFVWMWVTWEFTLFVMNASYLRIYPLCLNASHLRIYPLCLNASHLRIYPLCLNASHLRIYPLCLNVSHLRIYPLCFLFYTREAVALLLLKSSHILPALATLMSQETGYFSSLSVSLSLSLHIFVNFCVWFL